LAGASNGRAPENALKGLLEKRSIAGMGWAFPEWREWWFFRSGFQGRMDKVGIGCRDLAKDAMRHF